MMNELLRRVSERLKVIVAAHAALELEAEVLLRHVERKAALLKRASELEKEGMSDLASELCRHVGAMDLGKTEPEVPALNSSPNKEALAPPAVNEPDSTTTPTRKRR
jgi:hypothetical protein